MMSMTSRRCPAAGGAAARFRLVGLKSNRDAIGATDFASNLAADRFYVAREGQGSK